MNRYYEEFRTNIIMTINKSGLDIGAIYYIMKDVLGLVSEEYSKALESEKQSVVPESTMPETQEDKTEDVL